RHRVVVLGQRETDPHDPDCTEIRPFRGTPAFAGRSGAPARGTDNPDITARNLVSSSETSAHRRSCRSGLCATTTHEGTPQGRGELTDHGGFAMRINDNIMSLNAYRNLSQTESNMGKSLEKLSSGF